MPVMTSSTKHAWWAELRHSGMVVAPALLEESFPTGPDEPKRYSYQRLRERYSTFETWLRRENAYEQGSNSKPLYDWLDGVLDTFLGHDGARWEKGMHVSSRWKYQTLQQTYISPDRVLFRSKNNHQEPALFICIEKTRNIGQGRGRTAYGKMLELLRAKNVKLGLLTNGRQFRLCYAGLDYDSWVEWDVESWFAEEEWRQQLYGFYTLLGQAGMDTGEAGDDSFPLLSAAESSRSRQGELSAVLGEQVRESVELLLHELDRALREKPELLEVVRNNPQGGELSQRRMLEALYQSSVRIIMRLVIVFFAEARDMLPRSLPLYQSSYGIEGLYEQLRRAAQSEGRKELEERESAWVRLLGLFSLIYEGSRIPTLPVQAYGGLLFRPGDKESSDATLRAIALFESLDDMTISDATILRLLELLKNGKLKIKQGRTSRWVSGPVDFSELRTEYIGLMYQGLLDFNLHATNQPMIFLNLGQEPVLPLKLLEEMPDARLKDLLKKLHSEKGTTSLAAEDEVGVEEETGGEEGAMEAEEEETIEEEEGEENEESEVQEELTLSEEEQLRRRAYTWAEKAVELAGLVAKPKGKNKGAHHVYEEERAKRARKLIKQTLEDGEFYLIRRGGTRKGSGTFYTRPQLAVPITWRTLEPLAYTTTDDGTKIPRRPEEILSLKVCDPACGSASFLVAALHYLTDAFYASLVYYHNIDKPPLPGQPRRILTLPFGIDSQALLEEELLPTRPSDKNFESRTKGRLRRYVVERCIYGVDLSPLAVELARMSLWIETMDDRFPFTFLDHKIKVGNSLVGAWFDTFREYPIMAWMRDGGDTNHTNGVHYNPKEWTKELVRTRNEVIKPQLIRQIESSGQQLFLLNEEKQTTPENYHGEITAEMEQIHLMDVESVQEREERYLKMQQTPEYKELKRAFDSWCAMWFWPADKLDIIPIPTNLYKIPLSTQTIVEELSSELQFFHWELEFPEVFAREEHGFDCVLANPPWENAKPSSKEFFSSFDPLYRTYGGQEALDEQQRLFQIDPAIEREWILYQAHFKGMSNWAKHISSPFGDPDTRTTDSYNFGASRRNEQLHSEWRDRRLTYSGYVNQVHPFRYQGSSGAALNTYKMFLEIAHYLLKDNGRLGMLVPSAIYTDQGSVDLRDLYLNHCHWEWLFGFINWKHIFDIDSRFKFVILILEKNKVDRQKIQVAFNRVNLTDLESSKTSQFDFSLNQIRNFSPISLTIIEPQTSRDLNILTKIYANAVLFGSEGEHSWQIRTAREVDMGHDIALFPPLSRWEARGYRSNSYGFWSNPEGEVALPLYEGRMVGAFDPSKKVWISGKGRVALWNDIPYSNKYLGPQYLFSSEIASNRIGKFGKTKIGFMSVGSATNTRTMYASAINNFPCGHSISTLKISSDLLLDTLILTAILNSFVYDYCLRGRLGGLNLSYFILSETPLISPTQICSTICAQLAAQLNLIMPAFAPQWLEMRQTYSHLAQQHWRKLWAITRHERLRLRCILDAIIAELYGLDYDDFAWILRDDPTNPKGFWRVDKEKPKELRQTTLALAAFKRLKEVGLEAFQQEDWQFAPEIAAQLGPRFTPWQKEGTVEESWVECEMHAQRMKELVPPDFVPIVVEDDGQGSKEQENGRMNGSTQGRKAVQQSLFEPAHEQLELWNE